MQTDTTITSDAKSFKYIQQWTTKVHKIKANTDWNLNIQNIPST